MGGEDPNFFFARISRLEITMRAAGIKKSESDIVQIILRQLPERYDVVKTMTLADPQLTRSRLENTIRSAYSQRKAHEIAKQGPAVSAPVEPRNPHAFVVGRGFRNGRGVGGGGQRRDDGMVLRGGDVPQQQQQHWSRGGGMPRRQQQQQQQWSRGGGISHQHRRSSDAFPPARQMRQQQPQQQPSQRISTIGVGGTYDCESNDVYFQQDSPPPPGAPMSAVHRCGRCGKHGHKSEHCAAPRRFEDTCGACGQYGHIWRNCALSSRGQPHLNVFTSSGECPVTDAHRADIIVMPQQQYHQPAVDLGGEDIPLQQSSAWQQQLDLQHNGSVVEISGAPGGGSGGDGEDRSSPLSGYFFGGDGGTVEEWLQSENVEMPMFSLSEGPQQSAPTAVVLAAAAPAAEAVTGTRVFPAMSSKNVAEAPTSSAGAASAAVPAAAPATGGTVFPTASVGGGGQGARFCRWNSGIDGGTGDKRYCSLGCTN